MSMVAIEVSDLAKEYRIGVPDPYKTLRATIVDFALGPARLASRLVHGRSPHRPTTWALDGVSFQVATGELVGIIGRNGAGKSTLLKILSRITYPTRGEALLRGRVGAMLEVGTGFHPELTGRENVILSGAILGMRRSEIQARFAEIVAFAEIGAHLDTPVKRYSSGMYLRLAFAVAAFIEPEILLVDEVLAVGDVAFQKKCVDLMRSASREGRTILVVSHNLSTVSQVCRRTILLEKGRIAADGETDLVIGVYRQRLQADARMPLNDRRDRRGEGGARLVAIELLGEHERPTDTVVSGASVTFVLDFAAEPGLRELGFALSVNTTGGTPLFLCRSDHDAGPGGAPAGTTRVSCTIPDLPLAQGDYSVNAAVYSGARMLDWVPAALTFQVETIDFFGTGSGVPTGHSPFLVRSRWRYPSD
jgi:lipopolysaccharide transport system ATP-binding protein